MVQNRANRTDIHFLTIQGKRGGKEEMKHVRKAREREGEGDVLCGRILTSFAALALVHLTRAVIHKHHHDGKKQPSLLLALLNQQQLTSDGVSFDPKLADVDSLWHLCTTSIRPWRLL